LFLLPGPERFGLTIGVEGGGRRPGSPGAVSFPANHVDLARNGPNEVCPSHQRSKTDPHFVPRAHPTPTPHLPPHRCRSTHWDCHASTRRSARSSSCAPNRWSGASAPAQAPTHGPGVFTERRGHRSTHSNGSAFTPSSTSHLLRALLLCRVSTIFVPISILAYIIPTTVSPESGRTGR